MPHVRVTELPRVGDSEEWLIELVNPDGSTYDSEAVRIPSRLVNKERESELGAAIYRTRSELSRRYTLSR